MRAASGRAKLIGSLLACAAALSLPACGTEEPVDTPITISLTRAPDHLDPALASSSGALEALWLVYTPLLTYRHEEGARGAELIPGLASDLPEISADGLTYELNLRQDLEYSNGTEVRASDFERAIERVRELHSAGAHFYRRIAAIETDDESGRITIELTVRDREFADALALPYAAPVPARTPFRDLSAAPPPGVGPYEITAVEPDGGFVLERSGAFPDLDIPDVPTGNLVEIRATIDPSVERQAQDVLDGKVDYMQDPPPAKLRPTIAEQASDRYTVSPTTATAYFRLDQGLAPFDDSLVREAVNRGLARAAVARAYGGSMQPGCALLAPGIPGYDRDLDTTDCPYGDPGRPPDLDAARALIEQAGAEGARVIVASGADRASRAATSAYASDLDAIGLRARIEQCASCAQSALVAWNPDFPRPLGFFRSLVDDPFVFEEVDRLDAVGNLDPLGGDWSELDRYVVSPPQSYVAVLGHPTVTTFFSERMDPGSAVVHPVYGNDYSSWQLKEGE